MLYQFSIDDLIYIATFGALFINTIYHCILFYYNRIKLIGTYSLYLCSGLLFIIFENITKNLPTDQKIFGFLISSFVLWMSYSFYFKFILTIIDPLKIKHSRFLRFINKNYLFLPLCGLINVTALIVPQNIHTFFSVLSLLFNFSILVCGIIFIYIIYKDKRHLYNKNFLNGSACLIFFNVFNSISIFYNDDLFGLIGMSYICLGYFTEIIFFSIGISHKMRYDINEKYKAFTKIKNQELELEIEKKKASDILLFHHFDLENERAKAIIEQRMMIGRKLHDDLSGSLVALKYLVKDFKGKANENIEKQRFNNIEEELSNIYKDVRNYSHELSRKSEFDTAEISYDISAYLKKITEQFNALGLVAINLEMDTNELDEKLNTIQTQHTYFILKECITNTIKHAAAQNIWINIEFKEGKCIIYFKDDGKGIDNFKMEGLGLKGIRERVKDLGGTLEVSSNYKATTLVVVFKAD